MNYNNIPNYQSNLNMTKLQLAKAYVPYQQYQNLYTVDEALYRGTIFKDLYQPYQKE